MKATVTIPTEITVKTIRLELAVRYGEEDIPNDFPLRHGDLWKANVDIDTGKIEGWPEGKTGEMYMKVTDSGSYYLYGPTGRELAKRVNEYVPHGIVPGEYGDYVDLKIDEHGVITNWPKNPDVSAFFSGEED